MTEQLSLFAAARALGEEGGNRALERAERTEPGFADAALAFIEWYAATRERFTCEQCTLAAREKGITPPDDRAFGPVYAKALRNGLVQCVGFAPRVMRGHAAPGARIYVRGPNNDAQKENPLWPPI